MKKVKKVMEMIKINSKTLIIFESIFKLCTIFLFTPFFLKLFNLIMDIRGYQYLTLENIPAFFLNPLTILLLLILILLMMCYTLFDITTIIIILDSSWNNKKIKTIDAVRISLKKCQDVIRIKNIPMAFLVLFLIPFIPIGISSSFISTIPIPEFILEYIVKNKEWFCFAIALFLFFTILLLKWMYAIHYFLLENCSFKEARRKSKVLGKKKHIKDVFTLFLIQLINVLSYILFLMLGITLILFLDHVLQKELLLKSITTTLIGSFVLATSLLMMVLATPLSYATISVLYYFHKIEKQEKINHIHIEEKGESKENRRIKKGTIVLCTIAFIVGTIFTYRIYTGEIKLPKKQIDSIEITAHRGASKEYPENTMKAFQGAKEFGADWIELDVQQTKDGEIIVMHDSNLKRTTGINKYTWEVLYEEIASLDIGSFLSDEFKEEKIPLLKEVLTFAKENGIKLNIELKPNGNEIEFEKQVITLIKEAKFEENCVIASQIYSVLENVKKEDSNITTLYVMSFAYGDITKLTSADHFSIEASSITENLVKRIHKENKKIFAWTINTEEKMQKMIDLKVDNLITDNITLAKKTLEKNKSKNGIEEYTEWIENKIKN